MQAHGAMISEALPWHVSVMAEKKPKGVGVRTRLREARIDAGFPTIDAAAKALGWGRSTYSNIELGYTETFMPDRAEQCARVFHTTTSWLLYGEREQTPNMRYLPLGGAIGSLGVVNREAHVSRPGRVGGIRFVANFKNGKLAYITEAPYKETGFEPGTALICAEHTLKIEDLIGRYAVVCLGAGSLRLYKVLLGSVPGLYDLALFGDVVERNVRIQWGQRVVAMLPRGEWEHSSRDRKADEYVTPPCGALPQSGDEDEAGRAVSTVRSRRRA